MSEQTWYILGGMVLAILILRAITVKRAGGPSGGMHRAPRQPFMPKSPKHGMFVPKSPSSPSSSSPMVSVSSADSSLPASSSTPPPPALKNMEEVQQLMTKGDYIGAIKVFYTKNNTGLKEAKDFIDALRAGKLPSMMGFNAGGAVSMGNPSIGDLRERALKLKQEGNVIEAIKMVRQETGMGLKEAKDYVDNLM